PIFIILLIGSTLIGFYGVELFIAPGITPYGIDHELFPGHQLIKRIPLLIIFFVIIININKILFFYINIFFIYFMSFFNRRGFFDPLFNYLLAYPILINSYSTFKIIDRGFLEFFGPIGLFRFFFYFSEKYNLNNQNI